MEKPFDCCDLWHHLANTKKHIVLYGMGNGADKVCAACARFGVEIEDYFASDDFVRGQFFHGKRVMTYAQVEEKYGREHLLVLVSFATALPPVMEQVRRIAARCELYIPEVPVRGTTLPTADYMAAHRAELEQAYACLADERSREVFRGITTFRLTGTLESLDATADNKADVMRTVLQPQHYRTFCDVGAYDGDTIRELMTLSPHLCRIWALEPDRRNFRKLSAFAETVTGPTLTLYNCAAWKCEEQLLFDDSGNRNAGYDPQAKRTSAVQGVTIDSLLDGATVDYIKYDVEGAEEQALTGSQTTLRTCHPDLLISLYHRTEDLHERILQLHKICPEYRLYLRRYPYIPAWDLNLYAKYP